MSTTLNGASETFVRWEYDARGRTTLAGQGMLGMTQDLLYTYDSADRMSTTMYYEANETVTTTYDAAWRPYSLCGTNCYVNSATYTALDQPDAWTLGNTLVQDWGYDSTTARLSQLSVGSSFNRSYSYDTANNITSITDTLNAANSQAMTYDERDRLTCWKLNSASCTQSYAYDTIGNLTSGGRNFTWMRAGSAPRAPRWVGLLPPRPPANDVSRKIQAPASACGMPRSRSLTAAYFCPRACAPDISRATASNRGSQGRSPGPGVQGAGWPLAAARAVRLHGARQQLSA
jgi:YD repeat-containing protein